MLFTDLDIKAKDLPDLLEMAEDMINPIGDDAKFVKDVREAQRCLQNIKDIQVKNIN